MNTNTKKTGGKTTQTRRPYPYNITRNATLLAKLLEGFTWTKAVLRFNEKKILVADVTLTSKEGKEEVFKNIFGMDTPEGRFAIRQAEAGVEVKAAPKKTRVGKTEKERANGVHAKHEANKRAKKEANIISSTNKGCGRGSNGANNDSAKKAGLGSGSTKK